MYMEASKDVPKYVNNPINAYLLIKRLSNNLKKVKSVMKHDDVIKRGIISATNNNNFSSK